MPFDGSGTFNRVMRWQNDAAAGIKIKADRHDQEDDGFASGLSTCLTRDGQSSPTNDISWNGKKLTNLADPTLNQDAATKKYVDGKTNYSTPLELSGSGENGRLKFTGTTPPLGLEFEAQDLFFGVKSGSQWVWNDKADATGTDILTLTDASLMTLTQKQDGAAAGPIVLFARDNAFPAAGDLTGNIRFRSRNSAEAMFDYTRIQTQIDNPTASAEAASLLFQASTGGSVATRLAVSGTGCTFFGTTTLSGTTAIGGTVTVAGDVVSTMFRSTATSAFFAADGGSGGGGLFLRPRGGSDGSGTTNQTVISGTTGNMTVSGSISAGGSVTSTSSFLSAGSSVILSGTAGNVLLRPNGGADGTGTSNQTTISGTTGNMVVTGSVTSAGLTSNGSVSVTGDIIASNYFRSSGTNMIMGPATPGTILLRPNGYASSTNQTSITSGGNMTVSGSVTAGSFTTSGTMTVSGGVVSTLFRSPSTSVTFAADGGAGGGGIFLRPRGGADGSGTTNQTVISGTTGNMTVSGSISAGGSVTSTSSFLSAGSSVILSGTAGNVLLRPNGGADGTGTSNQTTISGTTGNMVVSGSVTAGGSVTSTSAFLSAGSSVILSGTAGNVLLRPNGGADGTGTSSQTTISGTTGNMVVSGSVTSSQRFLGGTSVLLAPSSAGNIYLRSNGADSTTGQTVIGASGNMNVSGSVTSTGMTVNGSANVSGSSTVGPTTTSGSSAAAGLILGETGSIHSKKTGTAATTHLLIANNAEVSPATVGSIQSTGSATAYNTSSDENLKEFIGPYDPLMAIEIIRADPVRDFTWKVSGEYAVGWGAQTSYEVSHDLASPPPPAEPVEGEPTPKNIPTPGEPGYIPWGMDQGKRTPYLWAALTWALDRIDELLARVEELEGGTTA